jgi:hypothetical protein
MFAGKVGKAVSDRSFGEGARQARKIVKGIDAEMKKQQKALKRIGAQAGDGMVAGLRSRLDAWRATVRAYVAATRAELDINSPSKVFMKIGEQTAEGFNQGFQEEVSTDAVPTPATPTARTYSVNDQVMAETGTDIYPEVRVFIGDRELTDIVDVQVEKNSLMGRDFAVAGRRDY